MLLIFPFFVKAKRKRLRSKLRGYANLKRQDGVGIERMRAIRSLMTDLVIPRVDSLARKDFFGNSYDEAEIVVRQFLLQIYGGPPLYHAILQSAGSGDAPICYPMPKIWRQALKAQKIPTDRLHCSLAWARVIAMRYGRGVFEIIQILRRSFVAIISDSQKTQAAHVYFDGLSAANLPAARTEGRSYDVCSWYANWSDRRTDISVIGHGVVDAETVNVGGLTVSFIPAPTVCLGQWVRLGRFFLWSVKAICDALLDLVRGRWWTAFLLAEAAKAAVVRSQNEERIAKEYLFHFSGTVYRPMWTYEAEAKSSRVVCYFYSTSEQPKLKNSYVSQRYEWGPATWRNYIVWDDYQEQVLRRDLSYKFNVQESGAFSFSDSNTELTGTPDLCVGVFDIQPHRKSIYFGMSTLVQYGAASPDVSKRFLIDAHAAIEGIGGTMLLKAKREIGKNADKGYAALRNSLEQSGGLMIVPSDIAAPRILTRCKAVICAPFTAAALYGSNQGLPTAYYDPSGWIQKDDKAAHGVPILTGIEELRVWLVSLKLIDKM